MQSMGLRVGDGNMIVASARNVIRVFNAATSPDPSYSPTMIAAVRGEKYIRGVHPNHGMKVMKNNGALLNSFRDVERTMRDRCEAGYSMDAGTNLQLLTEELDLLLSNADTLFAEETDRGPQYFLISTLNELIHTWEWLERVESLKEYGVTLANCGVLALLGSPPPAANPASVAGVLPSKATMHSVLGVSFYTSPNRAKARQLMGWPDSIWMDSPTGDLWEESELLKSIKKCESARGFEKAAALALWNGHLGCAVELLHKHLDLLEKRLRQLKLRGDSASEPPLSPLERSHFRTASRDSNISAANSGLDREQEADDRVELEADAEEINGYAEDLCPVSEEYFHNVSLVAMCLAGYSGSFRSTGVGSAPKGQQTRPSGPSQSSSHSAFSSTSTTGSSSSAKLWSMMCRNVICQIEEESHKPANVGRENFHYLSALCRFLFCCINSEKDVEAMNISSNSNGREFVPSSTWGRFSSILQDENLRLEDRIGFACHFVNDNDIATWLRVVCDRSKQSGWIEGLITTGFDSHGYDIMQMYVDRKCDIQTVALIVSRLVEKPETVASNNRSGKSSVNVYWLSEYRSLLNMWQMYFDRAYLDVEMGKLFRQRQANTVAGDASNRQLQHQSASAQKAGGHPSGGDKKDGDKKASARSIYPLPPHCEFPHVYIRCHFCGSSLPSDPMQQGHAQTLSKQRSIINCCASCKRQLPRCYVCSLYLGFVNPNVEFMRTLNHRRNQNEVAVVESNKTKKEAVAAASAAEEEKYEVDDSNVMKIGRWFFFCQRCRHGGHAYCIDTWFGEALQSSADFNADGSSSGISSSNGHTRDICGVVGCSCPCKSLR